MTDEQPSQIPPEVVEGFKADYITVGLIGHVTESGFMDPGIRPVYADIKMVGPAVTVSMPSKDTRYNRLAAAEAKPGDVIVVDCGADRRAARWGEMICFDLKSYGVAGLVIEGAISASRAVREMQFPVFSRSISGLVGRRLNKDGALNVSVQCGGVVVRPGDLVVGDDDGVVVLRPEEAPGVLQTLQDRFGGGQKESKRAWILSGRRYADYPGMGWEEKDEYK